MGLVLVFSIVKSLISDELLCTMIVIHIQVIHV